MIARPVPRPRFWGVGGNGRQDSSLTTATCGEVAVAA